MVGIEGISENQRNQYMEYLIIGYVRIKDDVDSSTWSKNHRLGTYIAKLGYKAMFSNEVQKW